MSLLSVLKKSDSIFNRESSIVGPVVQLHYLKQQSDHEYRPGFRASSMGYMCMREEVFKVLLPRPQIPKDASIFGIFEVGHAIHHRWQNNILGPAGVLKGFWHCKTCGFKTDGFMPRDVCPECKSIRRCRSCNTRMKKGVYKKDHYCNKCQPESWEYEEYSVFNREYDISGHMDGILSIGTEQYVWDLKTINSNGFERRISKSPIREHEWQLQTYLWLKNMKKGIIHYVNKDTSADKEFLIERNDSYRKTIIRRIESILKHREAKTLPDHMVCSSKTCSRAKSCPWVKECFDRTAFKNAMGK